MKAQRLIAALAICGTVFAQDNNNNQDDSGIAPQALDTALEEFAERSGLQVIYLADVAEGKQSPGAEPDLSDQATLDQLLTSTDLEYEFLNDNTVTLQATKERGASDSKNSTRPSMLMAQSQTTSQNGNPVGGGDAINSTDGEQAVTIDEIIVTGTNIRGAQNSSSPLIVFTREDIGKIGVSTTQDFVRTLTQNFGGGPSEISNASVTTANDAGRGSASASSGVNLRGLGTDSTLVLLNGRRLAATAEGTHIDISMIPLSAIKRIDVLTDGASAIYGSDAVGGVVNFVLRTDFEGAETRVSVAASTILTAGEGCCFRRVGLASVELTFSEVVRQ